MPAKKYEVHSGDMFGYWRILSDLEVELGGSRFVFVECSVCDVIERVKIKDLFHGTARVCVHVKKQRKDDQLWQKAVEKAERLLSKGEDLSDFVWPLSKDIFQTPMLSAAEYQSSVGDVPWKSYNALHSYIRRCKGSASSHPCTCGCGRKALDWSLQFDRIRDDTPVLMENIGPHQGQPYVLDVEAYAPMTRRCHIAYDQAHKELFDQLVSQGNGCEIDEIDR